ncbi:CSC1-like protein RXW8 [Solanum tuberosum]|uniref:CSC1-like protein RXW8 n=1 Tax=Solanum tuberosum TaxID=4113 RepID=UPI0003D29CD6|nr:PREDICTED: CSC1-like protein RXW8 [Solanum tuberosum]XP_006342674.1 PREDICTED: CSC1-like protein RXW8 [Solanum tuberosum]
MKLSALLTSAGVNISVCVVLLILYSLLRKQPTFVNVYFSQRFARVRTRQLGGFNFERFVPSPSWIFKAWEASDDEIVDAGGLDAFVLVRMIVFSFRIFSIATTLGLFLVVPLNYFGQDIKRQQIPAESLEVFTIVNVEPGSRWFWVHCLALYIISCSACLLLYSEYKSISKKRLAYFSSSLSRPSYFTVLVRSIPKSKEESYSRSLEKFFMNYYASSYLSHQIVYRSGYVQKLLIDAEEVFRMLKTTQKELMICGICGGATSSFKMITNECDRDEGRDDCDGSDLRKKESAAALVFFRNRYAALVASQGLQSLNPMSWVVDPAPEPDDMYWSNICVPYRLLWIRKIALLVASILFVAFFLVPVSLTQSLVHLDKLQKTFPFLRGFLKGRGVPQLVTGYLPSVVLILFSYIVPPLMMLFSKMEGSISRSGRKRSACIKVLYFFIWNVFFGNIVSGSVLDRFNKIFKDVNNLLSTAVPSTATFFMTYVLTSGWASLSVELLQPFGLICRLFSRFIMRNMDGSCHGTLTFPYHTEVPRILLFGLFGFAYAILAPVILPLLVVYYSIAYLVYRNQILNVYVTKYQTGGTYWPIVHNTTIFSMVLMQIIALAVFGFKKSSSTSSFTIPLIICTLLFHEYCRQRFEPLFKDPPAPILIEMDRQDEVHGRMKETYQQLTSAYCQFKSTLFSLGKAAPGNDEENMSIHTVQDIQDVNPGKSPSHLPPSCTSVEIKSPHHPLSHTSSPHLLSPHASLEIKSPPHIPSSRTSLEIRSPPHIPSSCTCLEVKNPSHLPSSHTFLEIRSPHLPSSRTSLEIKNPSHRLSPRTSLEIRRPHLPSPRTSLEIRSSYLPSPRTPWEIKSPHLPSSNTSWEIKNPLLPSPRESSETKSPRSASPCKSSQIKSPLRSPRESLEIKSPRRASPRKSSEIKSPRLSSPGTSLEINSPLHPSSSTSSEIEESRGK